MAFYRDFLEEVSWVSAAVSADICKQARSL